jgi:pimeloyl-ACP methyl ester carboxylesterase
MDASMPWFFSGRYLSDPKNIATYKSLIKYNPYPVTVEILERQLKALKTFHSEPWLSSLNIPTVVIASDEDIVAPLTDSEEIAKRIPNAKLLRISSGHASPIDNPKEVTAAILKAGKDLF